VTVKPEGAVNPPTGADGNGGNGGNGKGGNANGGNGNPLKGAAAADTSVKVIALVVLFGGLGYCLLLAGWQQWSHTQPFKVDLANFALFAAFIVVAGAIERFVEPLTAVVPPYGKSDADKADRALLTYSIALIVGIAVSSAFGLYFLEAIGVKIGTQIGTGDTAHLILTTTGDKFLRGLDIFITALIITGGTKQLHDIISSIEKQKETAAGGGGGGGGGGG
jgi:hypothetical protein